MSYTLQVQYNELTDEYYIILPAELLKKMNWKVGDNLKWSLKKDKSIVLKKIK